MKKSNFLGNTEEDSNRKKASEEKQSKEKPSKTKTALEAASSYLANRMRTAFELKNHLLKKGYSEDEITETVKELTELKYIDDYYYALRYFDYNHSKHRGSLRARRELEEKGVSAEKIQNALEDFKYENNIDEYSEAMKIARKEVFYEAEDGSGRIIRRDVDDRLVSKIARKLERSGFCMEDIYRILRDIKRID